MAAPRTSFQRRVRSKALQIPGTRPSLQNNQLLVSTGIPSLDHVIGGGLAAGTVLLIEEDVFGGYSRLMLKYFLAEGIMCKHGVLLASADLPPAQILRELPGPVVDDPGHDKPPTGEDDPMKIAWRYQSLPQYQSNPVAPKFGHYYDLTKAMDSSCIDSASVSLFDVAEDDDIMIEHGGKGCVMKGVYGRLLTAVHRRLKEGHFNTADTSQPQRNILRIGIHSLGSPQWGEEGGLDPTGTHFEPSLPRFLYALRSLLRSAFAVAVITVPTHLFHDTAFTARIRRFCDTVIHLESFAGSDKEKNPAYKDYHGLFNIQQLPRLNSLLSHMPDTLDLAFKLRRKKFTIEKLHLPPELSDTASRSEEDPHTRPGSIGCGSGSAGTNKLDF